MIMCLAIAPADGLWGVNEPEVDAGYFNLADYRHFFLLLTPKTGLKIVAWQFRLATC